MTGKKKKYYIILFIYTLLVAFFCSKMSPFYPIQEWSDVNLYFNIGKAIFNGQILYVDVFDHKGPLIFFIYGIGYLISAKTFLGVFFIQIVTWYIMLFYLFKIALLRFSAKVSLLISALFLLMFISHTLQGGSAEEFITCCMMISLYYFIIFFSDPYKQLIRLPKILYWQGFLFCIVLLIKFTLCVFWIFPLLASLIICLKNKEYKIIFKSIIYFTLGLFTILLPILLYFKINNGISEAIDSYIFVNANQKINFIDAFNRIGISFYQRLRFEPIEFFIIIIGAFAYGFIQFKNAIAGISITLSFLALFAIIFIGGYVYYYSIPYYVYGGLGLIVILNLINKFYNINKLKDWIVYSFLFIALLFSVYRKNLFNKLYTDNSNVVTTFLPYILNEEDKSLLNLSLDEANALFTYGEIYPNVKYFIAPNITNERYPELREEQTKYIQHKETNFIVLSEYTNNAEYFYNLDALKNNYELIATYKEYYEWQNVNRNIYLYKRKK